MRDYLQRQGYRQRRSSSSRFDEKSIPGTKGMTHISIMASSGAILGDLVNTVPPMLYGLSIMGMGTCFSLPGLTHLYQILSHLV